jgi:hypothetical protein
MKGQSKVDTGQARSLMCNEDQQMGQRNESVSLSANSRLGARGATDPLWMAHWATGSE